MNYYCVHSKGNFINQPNMRVLLLLLFCSVLCTHAQVSSRSDEMSESSFISYRLEGEPAHRLFLHKDTLRVEVKGIGHRHGLVNICFAGWKMPEAYFRQ